MNESLENVGNECDNGKDRQQCVDKHAFELAQKTETNGRTKGCNGWKASRAAHGGDDGAERTDLV